MSDADQKWAQIRAGGAWYLIADAIKDGRIIWIKLKTQAGAVLTCVESDIHEVRSDSPWID